MILIGLCGPAGSGKTTAARHLARRYGARILVLAEPVKQVVHKAFGLDREQVWGSKASKETIDPRYGVTPRWLMQHVGDGMRHTFGDAFLVTHAARLVDEHLPGLAVVEDVRFLAEAKALRASFPRCLIWKLDHPWLRAEDDHQSENEWRAVQADEVLSADKSVDALYDAIDRACMRAGVRPVLGLEAP